MSFRPGKSRPHIHGLSSSENIDSDCHYKESPLRHSKQKWPLEYLHPGVNIVRWHLWCVVQVSMYGIRGNHDFTMGSGTIEKDEYGFRRKIYRGSVNYDL